MRNDTQLPPPSIKLQRKAIRRIRGSLLSASDMARAIASFRRTRELLNQIPLPNNENRSITTEQALSTMMQVGLLNAESVVASTVVNEQEDNEQAMGASLSSLSI